MELIDLTKSQTTGFFKFIVNQTTHQTSYSKLRIPYKRDCGKTHPMRRYSTQQNVNTKLLWRKLGSKLVLNTPKINDKNQKIDLEILFGLNHHSAKQYPQMLHKYFFDWSIDIFRSHRLHDIFNRNTVKVSHSCMQNMSKNTKGIIVRLHPHCVTNWHYVTVDKKENFPWTVNAELWMQFMTVVSLHQSHKKSTLGWRKEKWKQRYYNHKKSLNHKRYSHETTPSSYVCHLKETLDVTPNLKWTVVRCTTPYSNVSKKYLLCMYEKLVIITYPRQHKRLIKQSELFCKCVHENKYLLKKVRANDKG